MHHLAGVLVAGTLLVAGCAPDLPPDWYGAELITTFDQSECAEGDPYGPHVEDIFAAGRPGAVDIEYVGAHFRCAQELAGYWMEDGAEIEVLVQPLEMDPREVAGCDCLYDLWMRVEPVEADTWTVHLWRRWDNLNDPNDPVAIGTEAVVVP